MRATGSGLRQNLNSFLAKRTNTRPRPSPAQMLWSVRAVLRSLRFYSQRKQSLVWQCRLIRFAEIKMVIADAANDISIRVQAFPWKCGASNIERMENKKKLTDCMKGQWSIESGRHIISSVQRVRARFRMSTTFRMNYFAIRFFVLLLPLSLSLSLVLVSLCQSRLLWFGIHTSQMAMWSRTIYLIRQMPAKHTHKKHNISSW